LTALNVDGDDMIPGPTQQEQTLATSGMASERRRSRRNECSNARGWLSAEAGTGGRNHRVAVTNLSLHGMGFSCESPLALDSVHWVVLDAGGLRASSRVRIVSCRKRDDQASYECGAEFF
jgi:hypothetical protein